MFSEAFSASIDMMIWFLFFTNVVYCITLTDVRILKNPCILGINPTWLWCVIFLMYCWIQFESICRGWVRLRARREAGDQQSTQLLCRVYFSCLLSKGSVRRPFGVEVRPSAVRTCLHLPARSSPPGRWRFGWSYSSAKLFDQGRHCWNLGYSFCHYFSEAF